MSQRFAHFFGSKEPSTERHLAATQNQARYVVAELAGSGSYMISMGHLVQGPFDEPRFLTAARSVVTRHDALRTHFRIAGREVQAIVASEPKFRHAIESFANRSLDRFREWALPHIFDDVDPLQNGSLIRFLVADYGDAWRFSIAAHHAITDGFSRGVMNRELLKLYVGEALPDATSYYGHTAAKANDVAAPVRLTNSLPSPARIFSSGGSGKAGDTSGQFVERDFSASSRPLRSLAKATGSTRFAVMSAVYALSLSGQCGKNQLSSFFQSEGRKAVGASNSVVGPFSNTLPLDLSFDPDMTFTEYAQEISTRIRDVVAVETQPLMELLAAAEKMPTVSLNQYPPASRISAGELKVGPRELLDRRTEYDLNLVWTDDSGRLSARAFYDPAIATAERVALFLSLYEEILRVAAGDPTKSCSDVLAAAKSDPLAVFPRIGAPSVPGRRIHETFFEWAQEDPEAPALVTTTETVTYGELADRSMAYRTALGTAGANMGDRVAILARRHPDMVAALLGVSASGASFALIDGNYPAARIEAMLGKLAPTYLISVGESSADVHVDDFTTVIANASAQKMNPAVGPPRDAAYHLFTSGTTGTPKLVSHPERTVQRFIAWQSAWLGQNAPKPVTMMMSGPSHDPVLRDILLPLSTGGTVAIPTEEDLTRPCVLRNLCEDAGVTVLHLTPASGRLLSLSAEDAAFSPVQAVFWGGDQLMMQQVEQWQRLAPRARQVNLYGASETPQAALLHTIDPETITETRVPIGRPTAWTGVRLVGPDGRPVALGEIGEIVIELDCPVKGAQQSAATDGTPSHATGDFGYAMPDGAIRFVGRGDRQIQFNGYRIELGEVEAVAETLQGVASAAALLGGSGSDQLWLFVAPSGTEVTEAKLRAELSRCLPSFMLPTNINIRDSLPVSRNGKVDLTALKAETDRPKAEGSTGAPLGEEEIAIAAIFKRSTGVFASSRSQSLADLGVDSLSTIETRLELEAAGIELPEGWEWMAISALAQCKKLTGQLKTRPHAIVAPVRVDTWMVIRCFAIIQVVLHHFGMPLFAGASILLIVLAGLSFGQMQLPAIVSDKRTGRIWAQIAKLLIPLVPASFGIYFVHILLGRDPHPAALLFYQNLAPMIDAQILGIDDGRHQIVWLWFLHAYLQIFLVVGLLLAVPNILGWVRHRSWQAALTLFGLSWVLMLAVYFLVQTVGKDPNTAHSDVARATTSILPFFSLGLIFSLATTQKRRAIAALLAILHFAFMKWVLEMHEEWLWLAGLALCLGLQNLKLPRFVAAVVTAISAQSLMIYLSHIPVFILINRSLPENPPILITALIALFIGVALGNAFRPVYRKLGVNRLAEKQIIFGTREFDDPEKSDRSANQGSRTYQLPPHE